MDSEQHRRRSVNERLEEINEPFAQLLGTYAIACECGDPGCETMIEVPAPVYVRVRGSEQAVVSPEHVRGAHVVASGDGWAIVQK